MCRSEGGIESCGEVLEVHTWGKHCVSAVTQHNWCCEVGCGSRGAFQFRIIIVGGLHALGAEWGFQLIETTLKCFVTC